MQIPIEVNERSVNKPSKLFCNHSHELNCTLYKSISR